MKGKIIIKDKVYFEYYGLEDIKPLPWMGGWVFSKSKYNKALKAYEASKQLIEVENVFWGELSEKWLYDDEGSCNEISDKVINNQPCKAEIKGERATIIELL